MFSLDKKIFIIEVVFMLLYFLTDSITTRKYKKRVDDVNKNLEDYFEGIMRRDKKPPMRGLLRALSKREDFTFWE